MMRGKRIDSNQPKIVKALRQVGAVWIPTSGDPTIGFDGLIAFRGVVYPAEIKDGSKSASRKKLTDTESKRQGELESVGAPYLVIESEDDALKMIGAIK